MTRNRLALLAPLIALALVAAACGDDGGDVTADPPAGVGNAGASAGSPDADPATDSPGDDAPAATPATFTAERLGGGTFDSAELAGRSTVLWFWAPWCTTCRAEAPDILEAAAEFDGLIEVIGVAGRGDIDAIQQFVDQTNTGELAHLIDEDGSIWTDFGVAAQPAFAFVDAGGEVDVFVGTLGRAGLTERMQALAAA